MLDWLVGWWNWPFLFSLLVGLGLAGFTIVGFGDGDGHADGDHGVPDIGIGKPDVGKPDVGKPDGKDASFAWLGGGKAPLTVLVEVLLVTFGITGLLVTAIGRQFGLAGLSFPLALVASGATAVVLTRTLAELFGKYLPGDRSASRRSGEFVGKTGTTASLVTLAIGQVRVEPDDKGPAAVLNACVDPTWGKDIARGVEVHLVAYDTDRALYRVRPLIVE